LRAQRRIATGAETWTTDRPKCAHSVLARQERVINGRGRRNPRGVKRKMCNFQLRFRHAEPPKLIDIGKAIGMIK